MYVLMVALLLGQGGSDAPDVHVYGARDAYARFTPHIFGKLLAGLELTGLGGQRCQDLELFWSQVQRLALHPGGEVLRVEPEVPELKNLAAHARRTHAPLEVGVDPRNELLHAKRLGYVVVGPGLEAPDLVFFCVLGGDHDDYHLPVFFADLLADPYPGLPGEHHIQEDEVWPDLPRQLQGFGPARRLLHDEPLPDEVVRQSVQDHRVVFDYQDLRRSSYRAHAQSTNLPLLRPPFAV